MSTFPLFPVCVAWRRCAKTSSASLAHSFLVSFLPCLTRLVWMRVVAARLTERVKVSIETKHGPDWALMPWAPTQYLRTAGREVAFLHSDDLAEAMQAFMQRRKTEFKGR